jgi:DNA modification methylase
MTAARRVLEGDALERLRELPDESVQCVVTSPPYWGLRDYGTGSWEGGESVCDHREGRHTGRVVPGTPQARAGAAPSRWPTCGRCGATRVDRQIGLEPTLEEFLERLVAVFREVRRVLRADGVCWVNMGDSYAARADRRSTGASFRNDRATVIPSRPSLPSGLKEKDLIGQPWRLAFALQADGWWLRSEVIWAKPTPMPESVDDRPTRSHEQVFLLTKAPRYFYDGDSIREPLAESTQRTWGASTRRSSAPDHLVKSGRFLIGRQRQPAVDAEGVPVGANKRTVWTISPRPFPEAHFATFPPGLVEPCILAGTSSYGACSRCSAPWRRVVEVLGATKTSAEGRPLLARATAVPGASPDLRMHGGHHGDNLRPRLTRGWQPSCSCWDAEYRRRAQLPRRARKRAQRLASGDWWRRVRCQPGDPRWPVVPCVVLDPFSGAATTGVVAGWYRRSYIGIELNAEYAAMSRLRLEREASPTRRPRPKPQPAAQLALEALFDLAPHPDHPEAEEATAA